MRSRAPLFALLLMAISFALPHLAHAAIPFFGPIIPPQSVTGVAGSDVCAAGWGMIIIVINNIISFLITIAIVFVAPLTIAYAGFLYVVNPYDPSGISKAKGILQNTVIGIVVALAGWMIVDAVMAVFYNSTTSVSDGSTLNTWSDIINWNGDKCLIQAGSLVNLNQAVPTAGVSATGALGTPPSGKSGTACDPAVVQAGAAAGGKYSLSTTQANILACIAKPESTCGTVNLNYNWGKGSSAAGAFQVLLKQNSGCYENKACYAAAGVNGALNCASGFDGKGNPIAGSVVVSQCTKAASNINCSASAAACLLAQNGGSFSPWQPAGNNAAQTACITSGG